MQQLFNMIRLQSAMANNSKNVTSLGQVVSYNPVDMLVIVELYPSMNGQPALQTGWIPLFSPWVGNGWGIVCAPNIGDIITVEYQEGSVQNAFATMRCFTTNNRASGGGFPAGGVPSGQFWLVDGTGSIINLTNDQKITISTKMEIDIIAAQTINVSAPTVNLGDGATGALLTAAAAAVFDAHVHTGTFLGPTSPPTTNMDGQVTSNTFAS